MEDEQDYLNIRYAVNTNAASCENSRTEYLLLEYKIDSITISYQRARDHKTVRVEVDFNPLDHFDPVYIICIRYSRLNDNKVVDDMKAYSQKGLIEYARIFRTEEEAAAFVESITKDNFETFITDKDSKNYQLELEETFIQPMMITYWKQ